MPVRCSPIDQQWERYSDDGHLAHRRCPAGQFNRRANPFDYLEEPDVFRDVFGHVPKLTNPEMADYVLAYGPGGYARARSACGPNWTELEGIDNLTPLLDLAQIDFAPIDCQAACLPAIDPGELSADDRLIWQGTGAYHRGEPAP